MLKLFFVFCETILPVLVVAIISIGVFFWWRLMKQCLTLLIISRKRPSRNEMQPRTYELPALPCEIPLQMNAGMQPRMIPEQPLVIDFVNGPLDGGRFTSWQWFDNEEGRQGCKHGIIMYGGVTYNITRTWFEQGQQHGSAVYVSGVLNPESRQQLLGS